MSKNCLSDAINIVCSHAAYTQFRDRAHLLTQASAESGIGPKWWYWLRKARKQCHVMVLSKIKIFELFNLQILVH